ESLRLYALEKLRAEGELESARRSHGEYFRDLLTGARGKWETRPAADWLAHYRRDIANIRAALDWAFSVCGDNAGGADLLVSAIPLQISSIDDCRQRAERALAAVDPQGGNPTRRSMQLYAVLGSSFMYTRGATLETISAMAKTLEIADALDDDNYRIRALWGLWSLH